MSFATNEKGRSNMNVVWIGFHEEGLPAFKAVLQSDVTISGFITLDDQAFEKRSAGSREYIILSEEKKQDLDRVTLKHDTLKKYFPKSYTPKQMEDTIIKLLDQWQKKRNRDMER